MLINRTYRTWNRDYTNVYTKMSFDGRGNIDAFSSSSSSIDSSSSSSSSSSIDSSSSSSSFVEPWTPAELTTTAWYDATDTNSVIQIAGNVSDWLDKSGNARHLTQLTLSKQPSYSSTGWDGSLPALEFFDDTLGIASTAVPNTNILILAVINQSATVLERRSLFYSNSEAVYSMWNSGTPNVWRWSGANVNTPWTSSRQVAGHIFQLPNQWKMYETGHLLNTVTDADVATFTPFTSYGFSGRDNIGNNPFKGEIAEIVMTDQIDDTTRQMLEGYLAWKWGLEGDLPIGHPYKNRRP